METENLVVSVFIFFLMVALGISMLLYLDLKDDNLIYETILTADIQVSEISIDSQKAEVYYIEASFAYEDSNYNLVESNCRLARTHYSEGSQGYKRIRAEIISKDIDDKLIDVYNENLEILSEISLNMFEACEHFESAARYYDKYYNGESWTEMDYEMGGGEIEMMNEKIADHDANIRKYNDLLEEFRVELNKRLEE